eukprot:TRINITY_DN9795_c1_g1_i1.p1 TRINITY_DN9795_c1_g1~~TRINITY_DN9795_c1_g1_i1.p1  ORF type:complete len:467 (-),score=84.10 TRINITY_DN9795_c1_g1_i1:877-2277(-)
MADEKPPQPLDVEEFRAYAHRMVDFIADYYRDVASFPVRSNVQPGYLIKALPEGAPEKGESLTAILEDVRNLIIPGVTHWQSPNFFAYFPSNSSLAGFLGDMLSGAFNVVAFSWINSPAATELETHMLDWLGTLLDLPQGFLSKGSGGKGGGVIQGTASEAVLVAMLAARDKAIAELQAAEGLSHTEAIAKLVAYTSDQAHSSVQKACMVSGLNVKGNFRALRTDASTSWALDPEVLRTAIEADKAAGLVPFFLSITVGTTSSTAIDPIAELGAIAKEHHLWMHVDAAYAGPAGLCPELRAPFAGLDAADSFCMNAHKWMLTNFDCSCLWVKDSKPLVNALSLTPEYMRNTASEGSLVVDYKDWQVPLGRRFRSLKLWFVMRLHGAEGLRAYIRKHIGLGELFEQLVRSDDRFEIVTPRTFALICFRVKPPAGDPDNGKTLNATLIERVNSGGSLFFTHTVSGEVC